MTVVTSQILKYYRNFFSQLKIYVTTPMSCPSRFSSYVTMITFSSSLSISFLQIQQALLNWNCSSSFSLMIKFLLKCFFINLLQYSYSSRIPLINSQAAFLPLKTAMGLINNYQYKQPCKQNYTDCDFDIFLSKNLHKLQHRLN